MSGEVVNVRTRGTMQAMQWDGTHESYQSIVAWVATRRPGPELSCDTYQPSKGEHPTGVMVRTPTGWNPLPANGWVLEYMRTHGQHNGFAALTHDEFVAAYVVVDDGR